MRLSRTVFEILSLIFQKRGHVTVTTPLSGTIFASGLGLGFSNCLIESGPNNLQCRVSLFRNGHTYVRNGTKLIRVVRWVRCKLRMYLLN